MKLNHVLAITVAFTASAMAIGCGTETTGDATTASAPAALFAKYAASVEAGDSGAVLAMLSDTPNRPNFPSCTADMSNKDCLYLYLNNTVVTQHTKFTQKKVAVTGNTVSADLEVRSDLTRGMGLDRIVGTDNVEVVDGKIANFVFAADYTDPQTAQFFAALGVPAPSTP